MGMNDNYKQPLFGSFQRLRDFALDPSTIHENVEALENYITSSGIAYTGQFVFVKQPVPSIYVVDLDNFHRDENGELQKYIRFAGLDDIEELKENTRKLLETLEKQFNDKTDKFNENLESATSAINAQVEGIKQEALDTVNSRLGEFYTREEADKLHGDIDIKISEEINKIFNGVDSETIDSLLDIIQYIEEHKGDYILLGKEVEELKTDTEAINKRIDELDASLDRDITSKVEELESKVDQKDAEIQSSISSLETELATKVSADDVKELIGGAKLKNVEQSLLVDLFDKPIFEKGTVIKDITIHLKKAQAQKDANFKLYFGYLTSTKIPLVQSDEINIEELMDTVYGDKYQYSLDYAVLKGIDGVKEGHIGVETNATAGTVSGTMLISYFLENN